MTDVPIEDRLAGLGRQLRQQGLITVDERDLIRNAVQTIRDLRLDDARHELETGELP